MNDDEIKMLMQRLRKDRVDLCALISGHYCGGHGTVRVELPYVHAANAGESFVEVRLRNPEHPDDILKQNRVKMFVRDDEREDLKEDITRAFLRGGVEAVFALVQERSTNETRAEFERSERIRLVKRLLKDHEEELVRTDAGQKRRMADIETLRARLAELGETETDPLPVPVSQGMSDQQIFDALKVPASVLNGEKGDTDA